MKHFLILTAVFLVLASFTNAAVPDSDQDGVPDSDDNCPNSQTTVVDQFGCSCTQKNCIPDNNPCTDDCGLDNIGRASCNVIDDTNECPNGYCSGGQCLLPTSTCPVLRYPSNGAVLPAGTLNPIFTWTKAQGKSLYILDITEDPSFSWWWNNGQGAAGGTTKLSAKFSDIKNDYYEYSKGHALPQALVPERPYYWRVYAYNIGEEGYGCHSPVYKFSIGESDSLTLGNYYFDTTTNEFVLTNKNIMEPNWGRGIWLSNKRIKVYRNVHGSNWIPVNYANQGIYSGFTLNPLKPIMPNFAGGGVIYVNDGSSHWSNNPHQTPVNENNFESRIGLGYTKQSITYRNLDLKVTYFVPSYDISDPVIIQIVEVKNLDNIAKDFKFFSYHDVTQDGQANFDSANNAVYLIGDTNLFLTSTEPIIKYDASYNAFFGSGGEGFPAAVVAGDLTNSLASSNDIMAAQVNIKLYPGEVREFAFVLGTYKDAIERNNMINKYKSLSNIQNTLSSTKQFYISKTNNIPGLSSRTPQLQTQLRLLGYSALSTSLWWDNFINGFTLNQMAQYELDVNARDTAQIALGLNYIDPELAREGIENYLKSQQAPTGQIPYGFNSLSSRNSQVGAENWGSDNIAWTALASCEYIQITGDNAWSNKAVTYRDDSTTDTVYNHIIKALNYDYTINIKPNGLVDTQKGDWLDQMTGAKADHGESVYASALLYYATQKCLPLMNQNDKILYENRANALKNSIENNAFDTATGRYIRVILEDGSKVGSSSDNRVFSDMAVIGLTNNFQSQRTKNTVLAAYDTNQGFGNLIYIPSYSTADYSLGSFTVPDWYYDNKVWGRICALVTAALKIQGLSNEAENNFIKCLPDKQNPSYASPFNYIEIYDSRGNIVMPLENKRIGEVSFSDSVDDAMTIWAHAQLAGSQIGYGGARVCDNNILEQNEQCDGTDLNGQTCASLGYQSGTLSCYGCVFDKSGCIGQVCTDSDNGIDYYKKGTTSGLDSRGNQVTYEDYCSGDELKAEWYCDSNGYVSGGAGGFLCPNGCNDGACISKSPCAGGIVPDGTFANECCGDQNEKDYGSNFWDGVQTDYICDITEDFAPSNKGIVKLYSSASNKGKIALVSDTTDFDGSTKDNNFDVVSNGNSWFYCDSENNGAAHGPNGLPFTHSWLGNGQNIAVIQGHQYMCFSNDHGGTTPVYETIAECCGSSFAECYDDDNPYGGDRYVAGTTVNNNCCTANYEWKQGPCVAPPQQIKYCEDGTAYGSCSANKPLFCNSGNLVPNSQACGCSSGQTPQTDGTCKSQQQPQTCADGTYYNKCSPSKPLFCNNGNLVNSCQQCGCSSGQLCQSDGTCSSPPTGGGCIALKNSGNPSNKLDIVYISENYGANELGTFANDASSFMSSLLSYEPFSSQNYKINVWRIDNTQDLGCNYNCQGVQRLICCDYPLVQRIVGQLCPFDQIIVLVNSPQYGGGANIAYSIARSYRLDPTIGMHEFGHTFGKLKDEYSYGHFTGTDSNPSTGGNCDFTSSCPSWAGLPNTACVQGCQYDEWFRPKQSNSMMLDHGGDFNPVGERQLRQKLGAYS